MKRLVRAPNVMTGDHWVNILVNAGIPCRLHNRYLQGALGEIPAEQCAPEIWLDDERDEKLALATLGAAVRGPAPGTPSWRCAQCGEVHEPQFAMCWRCQSERPLWTD